VTGRLPRRAALPAPAQLPPAGLPGLDPAFSRLVDVPESAGGGSHRWHVLDNGPELDRLGVRPVGTVLCVHGNPTWSYLWRRLLTAATDAHASPGEAWRVIAVDQLEMGYSERTGTARALAGRVRELGDLTDTLGLDGPVVTFGHDWGGVVSLGWAVDHPESLAGLMLLNTAVHQPEDSPIPALLRLTLNPVVLGAATVLTPGFLDTTLSLGHPSLPSGIKNAYRAPYATAARRGGIGAFVADIPVDAAHQSAPELDRIAAGVAALSVPALLLWGPRDPIFSDRYLDDLAARLPHADVHRFEGAGHLIAEDVDYASAALAWLGDNFPALAAAPAAEAVVASGEASATTAVEVPAGSDIPRHRLWHYLDELRDHAGTALIEMAPVGGGGPRVVSWQLLSRRVREIAAGLQAIGVKPGDRVSLLVPPGADLTAALYACIRIGAVVVVADAGLGLRGLTRAVRGARPKFVIGAAPGLAAARVLGWPGEKISTTRFPAPVARALTVSYTLAELASLGADQILPDEPATGDPAAVLFTSGSTGPAKGVVYTHAQLSAVRDALATQYGVGVGTGLVAGFAPFALLGPALGARSVTPDMDVTSPKTLTAASVAAAAAAAAAEPAANHGTSQDETADPAIPSTVVFLSPAALANVVATAGGLTADDHRALDTVRTFLSAGAPVSGRLLGEAARLMPNATAHTPYGMTEGLLMTDISLDGIRAADIEGQGADGEPRPASGDGVCVGVPAATTRVRISALDATGAAVGELSADPGITGEIVVSAPHVKSHYDRLWLTNRAATAGIPAGEHWHRTGDVGHLDEAGRLWVEGRMPHVITTAAGVITPVGPEQRIESVPGVAGAAVVGVGPAGVQQPVAVVESDPPARRVGLAPAPLAAAVRAAAPVPLAAVLVVPKLPTDIRHNSKIDRTRLAAWAGGILAGGRMRRP
jgi:olefin beta-lactone synthetase